MTNDQADVSFKTMRKSVHRKSKKSLRSIRGFESLTLVIILALVSVAALAAYSIFTKAFLPSSQNLPKETFTIVGINPNKKAFGDLEKGFLDGLRTQGYQEGVNFTYESLELSNTSANFQKTLEDTIKKQPDLIVGYTNEVSVPIYKTEQSLKTTVPFLSVSAFDVREVGVNNLNGSGTFVAAAAAAGPELNKKRLEIVKETLPSAKKIGVIANPSQPNYKGSVEPLREVAPLLGLSVVEYKVTSQAELDKVLSGLKKGDVDILMTGAQGLLVSNLAKIFETATEKGIPTLDFRVTSQDKVLITYGHVFHDLGLQAASIADEIFRGKNPGEIPVKEPRKIFFAINLKIADKIGVSIPNNILARTDKVVK